MTPAPTPGRAPGPLLCAALVVSACGGGLHAGTPIPAPEEVALRAAAGSGSARPMRVHFEWEYADRRGSFRGEGAARVNPPAHFRLDLFSTGEGSLQATLVDDVVVASGDLEGVRLPPSSFLYAMAGVFRPGPAPPSRGFETPGLRVLEYEVEDDGTRSYYLEDGRLTRLEERRAGRRERWIEIRWGSDPAWPGEARYRDDVDSSGVRWTLLAATETPPHDEDIYALPVVLPARRAAGSP